MKTVLTISAVVMVSLLEACSGSKTSYRPPSTAMPDVAIGTWQVVTAGKRVDNGLCYAFSQPISSEGTYNGKRARAYIMATRRTSGKIEVSVSSGYPYKPGSAVDMVTDQATFTLKAKDSVAWAGSDAQDKALLSALKTTGSVAVSGVIADGGTILDVYSTDGFAGALQRVKALCP